LSIRHPVIAVTGLGFEARIATGPGVVAVCGGNSERLDFAISTEVMRGCRGIISFGIAGGLCPDLAPGACVVARSIVTQDGRFATDVAWSRHLLRSIPGAIHADLAGGRSVLTEPAQKAALKCKTGAVAVDMESSLSAAAAIQHKLPFAAIRVVADPAHRALPHAAQVAVLADGSVDVAAVLRSLRTKPGQWFDLLRVALDTRTARATLRRHRALLGLGFGLVDSTEQRAGAVQAAGYEPAMDLGSLAPEI
jgi:hopanoid-associated phosphorylase